MSLIYPLNGVTLINVDRITEDQKLVSRLIKRLCSGSDSIDPLVECLDEEKYDETHLFSNFMHILSDLVMSEEEAREHYNNILEHTAQLERVQGRNVGFRVGMLDYLLNIKPKLQCPKFMELSKYESMVRSGNLDYLTGLFNRSYFDSQLEKEVHRAKRYGHTFSLLMMDIDDFKEVNDTYGHLLGDEVLKKFSFIIKNYLRTEDTAARYGGEEFVIILPHTDINGAKIFSERLLECVVKTDFPHNRLLSFSGGIGNYPYHAEDGHALIECADKSLYYSKVNGKRRISIYEGERRDSRRYKVEGSFALTPDQVTFYTGNISDISLTGMSGITEAELKPGQIITLRLKDRDDKVLYNLQAQVIWSDTTMENAFGVRYSDYRPKVVNHLIQQYAAHPEGGGADSQFTLFDK
ncbi:MAG: diguanylate cyclase [Spirochaetaceae bacterium]